MVPVAYAGVDQRLIFAQSLATFFMVQAVAHRLPVWSHHGQVHLGNDIG